MKSLKLFSAFMFVFLCTLLMFAPHGNALPTVTFDGQEANLVRFGNEDNTKLKDMYEALDDLGIAQGEENYKSEYDEDSNSSKEEDDGFPGYYDTTFSLIGDEDGPSGATITQTGSYYISGAEYLLVKDGVAHVPNWYLFDLNSWDGLVDIVLEDFWPDGGAISFVAIYGGEPSPVPEPATMLLLGVGLIGLAGVGRKKLL